MSEEALVTLQSYGRYDSRKGSALKAWNLRTGLSGAWGFSGEPVVEAWPTQHARLSQAKFTGTPAQSGCLRRTLGVLGQLCDQNLGLREELETLACFPFVLKPFSPHHTAASGPGWRRELRC